MKYYIIAGEASGDLHGANLIKALRKQDENSSFRAWGGELMQQAGAHLVMHYRSLAFMGFVEVLLNLRTILKNLRFCKQDILHHRPEAIILIDYPGFNMRIAKFAKALGIKVFYYIAPQIWAWKQKRVFKLKRDVDRILVILPFENEFYARFGVAVDYVGHPLLDAIAHRPPVSRAERLIHWGMDPQKPMVALLPGSRKQEITSVLPLMLKVVKEMNLQAVVAGAPSQPPELYRPYLEGHEATLLHGQTYAVLEVADAAVVTSGTATLETALFGVPQVVVYRASPISYAIARRVVKVKYISLVNLIMDRPTVVELIQNQLNEANLSRELTKCLEPSGQNRFAVEYAALRQKLGGEGASAKAAQCIQKYLS